MERDYLTKTDFMNWRVCPSWAWLVKHGFADPVKSDPVRVEVGRRVDVLAHHRYPDARLLNNADPMANVADTAELMREPAVSVILQGSVLSADGFYARPDVLQRTRDGWRIIEVKAATRPRAYYEDLAFQVAALQSAEIPIAGAALLLVNPAYTRIGAINPARLFTEVNAIDEVRALLPTLRQDMAAAHTRMLDPTRPTSCDCHQRGRAKRCPTFKTFHPAIPQRGTIYDLPAVSEKAIARALDRGVIRLRDGGHDDYLTEPQRRWARAAVEGEVINRVELVKLLQDYSFPLYFLDYEKAAPMIPPLDGTRPNQMIPFQFSVHRVERNGSVYHHEFLATHLNDHPAKELVHALHNAIGPTGSIVAWNVSVEKGVHDELARILPNESEWLQSLNLRALDLANCVTSGGWIHADFNGSWSIKHVLPVAARHLNHADGEISGGDEASLLWLEAVTGGLTPKKRAAVFRSLRKYCALDTWAMVCVWAAICNRGAWRRPRIAGIDSPRPIVTASPTPSGVPVPG